MLVIASLFIFLTLSLTRADNITCPTQETRENTLQCYTYPKSLCVTDLSVFSTNTSLYIGNSSESNLETEITVFRILNELLANFTDYSEECGDFYQTLTCLYLYTPCDEGKPLRLCEESCQSIKQSQCPISSLFFNLVFEKLGDTVFQDLQFGDCGNLNERVDGYPQIPTEDYSMPLQCTYVGLPGALNSKNHRNGVVKLVTDEIHDSSNIYETASHGVVQVLNIDANIWGDVCIEEGTSTEEIERISRVACNSVDYPGGVVESWVGEPSTSSGYYMIDKLSCTGNESQLYDCQHNGYDFKYCSPNRRLHVTCDKEVGTVKFDDRTSDDHSIGGVPIIQLDDGKEAEFCADNFTQNTGLVICKSANASYPNLTVTYTSAFEIDDFELATFNCIGDETRVFQCDRVNTTCVSGERVMISCNNYTLSNPTGITQLTTTDIIILVSSFIILVLLVAIVTVTGLFCRYRTTTNRKIIESQLIASRSNTVLMRTVDSHSATSTLPQRYAINHTVNSNAGKPIIENGLYDYNLFGFENANANVTVIQNEPHNEESVSLSPVSPIQTYMVTTLSDGSMPISDESMSIAFIQEYCRKDMTKYVIPIDRLKMGSKIGEGAFGIVYKGVILERTEEQMNQVDGRDEVAVKTLKDNFTDQELKNLLIECALLEDLKHPNILGLLAVAFDGKKPLIIIPFMENCDLKAYLKKLRESVLNNSVLPKQLSQSLLVRMSLDIAQGMEYLTAKRYVHRDLAARNCMLDRDLNVKVSDFGLSRELYTDDYYRQTGGKLPAKWMAPECLSDNVCNECTDVWSFGVTLWEIYSLGRNPYPGLGNSEMLKFLEAKKRMEKPKMCPDQIYDLMQYCWQEIPQNRPRFVIISHYLEKLRLTEDTHDIDINESQKAACVAIQEEEAKLYHIEIHELDSDATSSSIRRRLQRQDAVSLRRPTPFAPTKAICLEHLASRFEEKTKKAFMMHCMKSVSMDSDRFTPSDHYIIPYLSMSIPILDEQHRERTRSLNTVRKKTIKEVEKKQRHTCIGGAKAQGMVSIEEEPVRLQVPPRGKKPTSASYRGKPAPNNEENSLFNKST